MAARLRWLMLLVAGLWLAAPVLAGVAGHGAAAPPPEATEDHAPLPEAT